MKGIDWTDYCLQPAPPNLLCQFRRRHRFYYVGYSRDFYAEFNVSGLEWKLTGIAQEELDRMPLASCRQSE